MDSSLYILLSPLFLALLGIIGILFSGKIAKILPLVGVLGAIGALSMVSDFSKNVVWHWFPVADLSLELSASMMSVFFYGLALFSLLIYAIAQLGSVGEGHNNSEGAFALLATGGMGTAFFAQDLFTLFVGWEIMTWASFVPLLNRRNEVKVPRRYLVYNLAGAAALLVGIFLLCKETGSLHIGFISTKLEEVMSVDLVFPLLFFVAGFSLKAGILPLHRWLPSTYEEASDLFTGFLSGALSKAGVFGLVIVLFKIFPATALGDLLFGKVSLGYLLGWVGIITSLGATFRAINAIEVKRLLAWSSISQVGYIITALGIGSELGLSAALYHSFNHTVIKVLLFTVVAGVILRTGKTRFDQLGGLIYVMPFSFMGVLMGIIALAGMPPLSGFNSKWLLYSALVEEGRIFQLIGVIAASTAAFLYNYKLIYGIFLGHPVEVKPEEIKDAPWSYRIAMTIPLIVLMGLGMFPSFLFKVFNPILLEMGVEAVVQPSVQELASSFGAYNGFVVMNTFGIAFVVILILFTFVKGKSKRVTNRLDIVYAGEIPTEETPLHYGFGLGYEVRRIPFVGWLLAKTTKPAYAYIHRQVGNVSSLVRLIYSGNIRYLFFVAFLGAALFWLYLSMKGGM